MAETKAQVSSSPSFSAFGFGGGFLIFTLPGMLSFFGSSLATTDGSTRLISELEASEAREGISSCFHDQKSVWYHERHGGDSPLRLGSVEAIFDRAVTRYQSHFMMRCRYASDLLWINPGPIAVALKLL